MFTFVLFWKIAFYSPVVDIVNYHLFMFNPSNIRFVQIINDLGYINFNHHSLVPVGNFTAQWLSQFTASWIVRKIPYDAYVKE